MSCVAGGNTLPHAGQVTSWRPGEARGGGPGTATTPGPASCPCPSSPWSRLRVSARVWRGWLRGAGGGTSPGLGLGARGRRGGGGGRCDALPAPLSSATAVVASPLAFGRTWNEVTLARPALVNPTRSEP